MKIVNLLTICILCLVLSQSNAQTEPPKGFKNGIIETANGNRLTGFIKDNIRNNASLVFIAETGDKKKTYDGADLNKVEIAGDKFICIKGDFFKVLSEGELNLLQKSSDASGKPTYNGNEAIFASGTEGKLNDYFIYNNNDKKLVLVPKKNAGDVIAASFAGNAAALDKLKGANGDLAQLKAAVEIYNNRNR